MQRRTPVKPRQRRLVPENPTSLHGSWRAPAPALAAPGLPRVGRMDALISRSELYETIRAAAPPVVLEVLPRPYWRKHHLPAALSLPPDQVEGIRELVPDPATALVVYCWDDT